jgi:protein involved in polysaccharide export with SLBB domain
MKNAILIWSWCVPLCLCAGCYNAEEVNAFLLKPRGPVSGLEYRVLPPDVLLVTSRHVPEITGVTQQVRPDGKINLPLVGEVVAANRTTEEIQKEINDLAKQFYEQVDVTVTVTGYNSHRYYVFGEVTRAGAIPWTGHDSLLDALAMAQPTFLAWPERIFIVRGDEPQEGGKWVPCTSKEYSKTGIHPEDPKHPRKRMMINLMAMIRQGDLTNNILLKPDDVIYVQPNPLAAIGEAIQMLLFPVRPMAEAVSVPYTNNTMGANNR